MKLKKIIIENFRGFRLRQELDFSIEDGALNLIIGENEVGKTSILNSVLWCLYGRLTNTSDKAELIKNQNASDKEKCLVEIHLAPVPGKEDGDWITLRRILFKNGDASVARAFDVCGVTEKETECEFGHIVNRFLHETLSKYYLFDGEGVHEIVENERLLKNAILDIQGLNIHSRSIIDLDKYIQLRKKELVKDEKASKALSGFRKNIERFEKDYKKIEKNILALEKEKGKKEKEIAKLRAKNKGLGDEEIKNKVKLQESLEKNIPIARSRIKEFEKKRAELIRDFGIPILAYNHTESVNKWIDTKERTTGIPSEYHENLIDKLLEAETCICGQSFENHSNDKSHKRILDNILSLRENAQTDDINVPVRDISSLKSVISKEIPKFNPNYSWIRDQLEIWEDELSSALKDKAELDAALTGNQLDEIKENQEKINLLEDEIFKMITTIGDDERALVKLNASINENKKEIDKASKNQFLDRQRKEMNFLEESYKYLKDLIEITRIQGKKRIETEMNELLRDYARGNDKFLFRGDSYDTIMLKDGHEVTDLYEDVGIQDILILSQGGAAVKRNLFFAVALTKISESILDNDDDYKIIGKKIPFLVDAPFSNLDSTNTQVLFRLLVDNAFQSIILISSGAFNNGIENILKEEGYKNKLKKLFVLKRQYKAKSTFSNSAVESTPIKIKNKTYPTSFYGADVETSLIEDWSKKMGIKP